MFLCIFQTLWGLIMSSSVGESRVPELVADLDVRYVTIRKTKTTSAPISFTLDDNSHVTARNTKKTCTSPSLFLGLELGDIDKEIRALTPAPSTSKPSGSQDGGPNSANNESPKFRYLSATISSKAKERNPRSVIKHQKHQESSVKSNAPKTANSTSTEIHSSKTIKRNRVNANKSKKVIKGDNSDCQSQSHTPNIKERSWSSTCKGGKTNRKSSILYKSRAHQSNIPIKPLYITDDSPEKYAHMSAETFKVKQKTFIRKGRRKNIREIAILNNCLNKYSKANEQWTWNKFWIIYFCGRVYVIQICTSTLHMAECLANGKPECKGRNQGYTVS